MTGTADGSSLQVRRTADGTAVLSLSGDFDVTRAATVGQRIGELLLQPGACLVIDLHEVTFLDSKMLATLLLGLHKARLVQRPLVLVRPVPSVWQTFVATGLAERFTTFGDLEEATRALHPVGG